LFEVALQFISPIAVSEAPVHATVLANVGGARNSALIGVAAITLAERARTIVSEHSTFKQASNNDERLSVDRLRNNLSSMNVDVPELNNDPCRWSALFAVLRFIGISEPNKVESVLVFASLVPTLVETWCHEPGKLMKYPMNVPEFVYEEGYDDE
jgi:hypothetical protein